MAFSLFGNKKEESAQGAMWIAIHSPHAWESLVQKSHEKPQVIFKHSTRCIISKTVLRNFEAEWKYDQVRADLHLLDLLAHRDISNQISSATGVYHESPQLIILHKGKAVYNASHQAITATDTELNLKGL